MKSNGGSPAISAARNGVATPAARNQREETGVASENGKSRLHRPWSHGLSDGRTSCEARRSRHDRLQPQQRQGPEMGLREPGQDRFDAQGSRSRGGFRLHLRRQRRRPALGDTGRQRRARRHDERRHSRRQHHRLGRRGARAPCRREGQGHRLPRRAGLRRPGGRRERPAHGHGRRRPGRLREGQAGHRELRQDGRPDGAGRRWPAHQDGQPDLHRRPRAGPVGGHSLRQEGRARCRNR